MELDYEEEAEELDEKDKKSYEIIQKMIEGLLYSYLVEFFHDCVWRVCIYTFCFLQT